MKKNEELKLRQQTPSGPEELPEEALSQVAGGMAMSGKTVSDGHTCSHFECCWCGGGKDTLGEGSHGCHAQGHGFVMPDGTVQEAVFTNTCLWCAFQYCGTCTYGT